MSQENLQCQLEEIRHHLSHLYGEVTALEKGFAQVLLALRESQDVANHDELTGLLRRRTFFKKWQVLLEECRKQGEGCGVLMVDVDYFKRINDTHGHQTGDEVLKRIAALLKQYESPNCIPVRLGGEEFAVAIRGTDAQMLGIAEFIRRGTERMHGPIIGSDGKPFEQVQWKCTLSVGMASALKSGYDPSRLLKAADEALYQAKQKGRNRVMAA